MTAAPTGLRLDLTPPKGYLPAQEEARALLEDAQGPQTVLLSGGQGAGKSYWAVWQLLRLHFVNVAHVISQGGTAGDVWGLLLAPTHTLLRKGLAISLSEALHAAGLGGQYRWNKQDGILSLAMGGGFYTFTMENPERIVSVNVSEAVIDEPGTAKKAEAIQRVYGRLRGPGLLRKVAMAGTPEDIISRAWFYDFIASPEAQMRYGAKGDNTRRVVFAATEENSFLPDLAGYIASQKGVLTRQQQLAYLFGQFVAFNAGRVYGAFVDRSVDNGGHRIPEGHDLMNPPGAGNDLCLSVDFNVNPMSGVIFFQHGQRGIRVLDEIRVPGVKLEEGETPIARFGKEVLDRWVGAWHGAVRVYGDATADRLNVAASKTGWALLHDILRPAVAGRGLDYFDCVGGANPREIDRVNSVNAAFERDEILVAEKCLFLRKDLNLVGFKEGTSQIDKESDHDLTHLSDALGYGWCQRTGLVSSRITGKLPPVLTLDIPSVGEQFDFDGGRGDALRGRRAPWE